VIELNVDVRQFEADLRKARAMLNSARRTGGEQVARVQITLKTTVVHTFEDYGRAGGSYSNEVRYEGAFVIVRDVYGKETAFPAADVARVEVDAPPGGF
jgi:hypothetical protein